MPSDNETQSVVQSSIKLKSVDIQSQIDIQALIDSIEPKARKQKDPYNFITFVAAGKFRHGNKFNYSKIGINDITGCKSVVTIICNLCGY
jgi:hypothetical protein